jgi:RsiW-degrading membrane proteinase PrsW (M82 family)
MTTILWQSLVTGVIAGLGFALYLRLMKRADKRVMVQQTLMVAALAAAISFTLRVLF